MNINIEIKKSFLLLTVVVFLLGLQIAGCAPGNPLIGEWKLQSKGNKYQGSCFLNLKFLKNGTVKSGSDIGTYKLPSADTIIFDFPTIGLSGPFINDLAYDYRIREEILSISGGVNNLYCEYSKLLPPGANTPISSPTATLQRSLEQNDLLASIRGKGIIVFSSTRSNLEDLYIIDPDGSNLRLLTEHGDFPDCSPDGKQIVAHSQFGNLFIINIDGTNRFELSNTSNSQYPRWSPDNKKIVYESYTSTGYEIFIIDANGSGQVQLTTNGKGNERPVWTADGQIAYFSETEGKYYMINSDGSNFSEITESVYSDYAREWAPDKSAYVVALPTPNDSKPFPPYDINVFSADGSVSVRLWEDDEGDFNPTWCP